ncbi:MAG: hypothetical protein ACQETK_12925, partial [Pseudomonadota bacterium]
MNKRFAVPALVGMLSAGLLLSACGGGDGGAFGPERANIDITGQDTLPPNLLQWDPQIGGAYTATLQVSAENDHGPIVNFLNEEDELENAEFQCQLIDSTLDRASLYYMDGSEDRDLKEDPETGEWVRVAYRSITLENNSGSASFHLHAGTDTGTATVRCGVVDPASIQEGTRREFVFAEHTIEIGATGSGDPVEILMRPREGMIYPPDFAMPSTDQVEVVVLD